MFTYKYQQIPTLYWLKHDYTNFAMQQTTYHISTRQTTQLYMRSLA